MKKPKAPCKECEKRTADCRITCEEWEKYEEQKAIYKDLVLTEKKKSLGIRVGSGDKTWIR